jgi:hypothetical protein
MPFGFLLQVFVQIKKISLCIKNITQLIKFFIYFSKITSLSITNLRITENLYNH